jgi:putative transcriptional regulator
MADAHPLDAWLVDYVLGTLAAPRRAEVEVALSASPALKQRVQDLEQAMRLVGFGLTPPRNIWAKVANSLEGVRRFEHLLPQVAELFDVDMASARTVLNAIDGTAGWMEGPAPGIELFPVEAGPKCDGFLTVIVRLAPHAQLPMHTHGALERVLVLEGGYVDDQTRQQFWRGELDERQAGTSHSFTALEGAPCLCASVSKLAEEA